jgi:hypothetical protein
MTLTAATFDVNSTNATPDEIAKLNLALSYLAKSETGEPPSKIRLPRRIGESWGVVLAAKEAGRER